MIICKWKVRLKLGVVCKCIIWISRSNLIMTIFRQSYQSYAPFCSSNFLKFCCPHDNLWTNHQMCGMRFRHFLLKLLQNTFNIWTYKVTLALGDSWPTSFYIFKRGPNNEFFITRTPLKTGGELRCSRRVSSSCSTSKMIILWSLSL
jgi:hypothetical protein